jgi:SAM-dependent methyltransferase
MKQNKYNDPVFFDKYSQMSRSIKGLAGAGEWKTLEKMLPDFKDKRVLDLGCGFGWHCQYAIDQGAKSVIGSDISSKMIDIAREKTSKKIKYICEPLEDSKFDSNSFDIVLSSLTFHYINSFEDVVKNVYKWLVKGGHFVFSVEHPVFTAEGSEQWHKDENGKLLHFPVDNYYIEREINASFLDESVQKYHRTLTTYVRTLLQNGFEITDLVEPHPEPKSLKEDMKNEEMRRPLMLIISARKK